MQIVYYDEAGDDGFPKYSSPVFVLVALYIHHLNWKETYENTITFRRSLKEDYGLPIKIEMHAKEFILNKYPYKPFAFPDDIRIEILSKFCQFIGSQNFKIINVSILKPYIKNPGYEVLDTSLKFSVQRVENDLNPRANPDE